MRIYFIRHGESTFNAENLHQHGDVPLSELGRKQAAFVGERLKSVNFDALLSSDYARARETAEIIGRVTGKIPEFLELARERRMPAEFISKQTNDPSLQEAKDLIEKNIEDPNFRFSDEENFHDLKIRAKLLLEALEERSEESVILVLHGTILRYVIATMAFGSDFDWTTFIGIARLVHLNNTGITLCEQREGRWRLITWNDSAHLGEVN